MRGNSCSAHFGGDVRYEVANDPIHRAGNFVQRNSGAERVQQFERQRDYGDGNARRRKRLLRGKWQTFTATVGGSTTTTVSTWTCMFAYTPLPTCSTPNPTQQTGIPCTSGSTYSQLGGGSIGTWVTSTTNGSNVLTYTAPGSLQISRIRRLRLRSPLRPTQTRVKPEQLQ